MKRGLKITDSYKRKHELHLSNKKIVRDFKDNDKQRAKKDPSVCSIVFDLQKVLLTPPVEIGPLYYMRKLSIYNFTIFSLGNNVGSCHLWNQTVAGRGSNDMSSILWKYIREKVSQGVKEFYLYSDECGGQNRNQAVLSMLTKASIDFSINITYR